MENNTIVLTYIYSEFWGTKHFRKSCERMGFPVHNAFKGNKFTGNGDANRQLYEALKGLENDYENVIYADGADSLFIKPVQVPKNQIVYSTEKAVWPPTDDMKSRWKDFYEQELYDNPETGFVNPMTGTRSKSPWKYLNAGGWCGPTKLLIEYFEKYGLNKLKGDVNGQDYHALAFLKAWDEDFLIGLDTQCTIFQTTAFEHEGDFYANKDNFRNLITDTTPSILHGNGRTDMTKLYNLYL